MKGSSGSSRDPTKRGSRRGSNRAFTESSGWQWLRENRQRSRMPSAAAPEESATMNRSVPYLIHDGVLSGPSAARVKADGARREVTACKKRRSNGRGRLSVLLSALRKHQTGHEEEAAVSGRSLTRMAGTQKRGIGGGAALARTEGADLLR